LLIKVTSCLPKAATFIYAMPKQVLLHEQRKKNEKSCMQLFHSSKLLVLASHRAARKQLKLVVKF